MFGGSKNNADKINGAIDTIIGNACQITGDISSKSSIRIEGHIDGNVSSDGMIVVAEKGSVNGDVKSNELIVFGGIDGQISTQTLHLQPTSKIHGDINTQNLHVEPGAIYEGAVSMHKHVTDSSKLLGSSTTDKPSTIVVDSK